MIKNKSYVSRKNREENARIRCICRIKHENDDNKSDNMLEAHQTRNDKSIDRKLSTSREKARETCMRVHAFITCLGRHSFFNNIIGRIQRIQQLNKRLLLLGCSIIKLFT